MDKYAKELLEAGLKMSKNGGIPDPILIVEDETGTEIIELRYRRNEKLLAREALRETLKEASPTRVALLAKVWVGSAEGSEKGLIPAEDPNRREAIHVSVRNDKNEKYSLVQFFHRTDTGKIILEGEALTIEETFNRWLDDVL